MRSAPRCRRVSDRSRAVLSRVAMLGIAVATMASASLGPDRGTDGITRLTDDATRVLGPSTCAECHVKEFEVWKDTAHEMGAEMLTRNKDAQKIARALGIRRVKNDARCTTCHFTMTLDPDDATATKSVAGVSCESCHGPARDWLDAHDDFGEATSAEENAEHRAARIAGCEENGMVHPASAHTLASQCYACHLITDQELIDAGHPTGADFEMVAWTQGEVRHNFSTGGGTNVVASIERRRVLYVVGQMLELEHLLVALAAITEQSEPFDELSARATTTVARLREIVERAGVMEVDVVLQGLGEDWLPTLGADYRDVRELIADCAMKFNMRAEEAGAALSALDDLLPSAEQYVGTVKH